MAYNGNSIQILSDFIFMGVTALTALRRITDISQEAKFSLRDSKGVSEFLEIIFCYTPSMNWSERQRKASSVLSA